jgi:hypothetical protein
MLASPFAFLRGSAVIMADDLAATPERNLVFDVNDFEEAPTLKRQAVSTGCCLRPRVPESKTRSHDIQHRQ